MREDLGEKSAHTLHSFTVFTPTIAFMWFLFYKLMSIVTIALASRQSDASNIRELENSGNRYLRNNIGDGKTARIVGGSDADPTRCKLCSLLRSPLCSLDEFAYASCVTVENS